MAEDSESDEWELSGGEDSEDDYDDCDESCEATDNMCSDVIKKRKSTKKSVRSLKKTCSSTETVFAQKKKLCRKAIDVRKKKSRQKVSEKSKTNRKLKSKTNLSTKALTNRKRRVSPKAAGALKKERTENVSQNEWIADTTWKSVPNFDEIETAATFTHENNTLPVFYFKQFFSELVWQLIVDETNRYAVQQESKNWSEVTIPEMQAFIGMIILMGVNNLPAIDLYWSSNPLFYNPTIASIMTCKRFKKILENIHLNDNEKMPKRSDARFDKLYKIRPFLNQLSENFIAAAESTKSQSIDESMILFTGRSAIKQYMPKKPKIRRGYKVWSRRPNWILISI